MKTAHPLTIGAISGAVLAGAFGALAALPAMAQGTEVIGANLFGEEVSGGGAGEAAAGEFNALVDGAKGEICYYLEVDGVDQVTGAHIHEGGKGDDGAAVVTLELAEMDERCVTAAADLVAAMIRAPDGYYVDVHTAAHPGGAVRGQLN